WQVFGLMGGGARPTYLMPLPKPLRVQCSWHRSFPITAAGQLRSGARGASPDSLLNPPPQVMASSTKDGHKILWLPGRVNWQCLVTRGSEERAAGAKPLLWPSTLLTPGELNERAQVFDIAIRFAHTEKDLLRQPLAAESHRRDLHLVGVLRYQ